MSRRGAKVQMQKALANGATPVAPPVVDMTGWEIYFNLRVKERKTFMDALNRITVEGDETLMIPWLARFIIKWPYDNDPSDLAGYEDMLLTDLWRAIRMVTAEFQRINVGN